jgi:Tol biopolymer transport system component
LRAKLMIRILAVTILSTALIYDLGHSVDVSSSEWVEEASAESADSDSDEVQNPTSDSASSEVEPSEDEQIHPAETKANQDDRLLGPSGPIESGMDEWESYEAETKILEDKPFEIEKITEEKPFGIDPIYVRAFTDITTGHNDSNPVWSPSGQLIAFERSTEDRREIIISRVDGSVLQRIYQRLQEEDSEMDFLFSDIIDDVSYNAGISWSPDEKQLVFMSNGGSGNYDLYLLPVLGQERTVRLTEHREKDSHPQWSPVSDRLIFVSGRTGIAEVFLMDIGSRQLIKLTSGDKTHLYPQWSPDGKKVVMIYGSNENHDVYLIDDIHRPTETLKALTRWDYDDLRPVWSPDGTKIAFYSNYNQHNNPKLWSIIVIAADGTDASEREGLVEKVVAVNVIPDIERGPAWMPDSKRIVYVKNDQQAYNPIYIVHTETKINEPINTQTKMNHDVVCSPDGTLAFRAQVEQWDHIYVAKLED